MFRGVFASLVTPFAGGEVDEGSLERLAARCLDGGAAGLVALLAAGTGKAVLAGDDAYLYPMMRLGASGGVTASACLAPGAFAELARAGGERGRELHGALLPLVDALFAEPSPSVLKACLAELGVIDDPAVRAPLRAPRPENVERALKALP
ncbi:dihydrodipicolinate synthase family protein [Spirillospora sp. NPDC052242]